MPITWTNVSSLDPNLAAVPTATQNSILAFVFRFLHQPSWGAMYDDGCMFLAAHLASLSLRGGGVGGTFPLQSERVGDVSRTYDTSMIINGVGNLAATAWGEQYSMLAHVLFAGGMVI